MPYYVRLVKCTFVARSLIKANTARIHEKYMESRKIGFLSLKPCFIKSFNIAHVSQLSVVSFLAGNPIVLPLLNLKRLKAFC